VLVLSRDDVRALLDLDGLIDALGLAMADLSAGRASVPDRIGALVPEREGRLIAMPGYVPSLGALVSKVVSLFPHNAGTVLPTHQAVIVVFDPETGSPVALLDGRDHCGPHGRMFGAVGAVARARGRFGAGRAWDGRSSTLARPCCRACAADP
jgi:ornithine cyclodeaminase/alanine dehydrogenase-like protein (mu-crystallin family)